MSGVWDRAEGSGGSPRGRRGISEFLAKKQREEEEKTKKKKKKRPSEHERAKVKSSSRSSPLVFLGFRRQKSLKEPASYARVDVN